MTADTLLKAAIALRADLAGLRFTPPVSHVYDPLTYAWDIHAEYLRRYGAGRKQVLFLGMNPGPFGMAQNGVPFGEIAAVRDWLGLEGPVGRPVPEHPKRPISGFACKRSEVSGRRLWGMFAQRFITPKAFFAGHFVANYCPLVFMEAGGKNRTPDQLTSPERTAVETACDRHLHRVAEILRPDWLVGVGRFADARAQRALADLKLRHAVIPHPSPANPAANRDWAGAATKALLEQGVWKKQQ